MRKKLSVTKAVLAFIKKQGGSAPVDSVTQNVNKPINQIHTAIWKMTKSGALDKQNGVLKIPNATTTITIDATDKINSKTAEAVSDFIHKTTRRATAMEMELGKRITKANEEIETLRRELTEMSVKYYDAMAVVRYLENKLG